MRESENGAIYVEGLEAKIVSDPDEVMGLLKTGESNRHYGATNMNDRSSRSHTIFRLENYIFLSFFYFYRVFFSGLLWSQRSVLPMRRKMVAP